MISYNSGIVMVQHISSIPHIHTGLSVYTNNSMDTVARPSDVRVGLYFGVLVYTLEKPSEIFWVDAGGDSMPQICDPTGGRARSAKGCTHPPHFSLDSIPTTVQHGGVQVSLQAHVGWYRLVSGIDRPIEANDVVRRPGGKGRRRALGKQNHGHDGESARPELCPHAVNDLLDVRQRKLFKVVRGQVTAVGIKHLEELTRHVMSGGGGATHGNGTVPARRRSPGRRETRCRRR